MMWLLCTVEWWITVIIFLLFFFRKCVRHEEIMKMIRWLRRLSAIAWRMLSCDVTALLQAHPKDASDQPLTNWLMTKHLLEEHASINRTKTFQQSTIWSTGKMSVSDGYHFAIGWIQLVMWLGKKTKITKKKSNEKRKFSI